MFLTEDAKVRTRFGDNLHDVAQYLTHTPRNWRQASSESTEAHRGNYAWDLGALYTGAVKLADTGWTEGALALDHMLAALPPNQAEPEYEYDVAGYMPDVSLYCAGDPMHMVNDGHPQGRKPIVHLVINMVCSASVPADSFRNYGAAMTAMIGQIEATGRRVELDVTFVFGVRGKQVITGWKVKRAEDHVDLAAVAFSLAHPAAFRRLGFALMERSGYDLDTPGYGSCGTMCKEDLTYIGASSEAHILGGIGEASSSCRTLPEAVKFAAKQINKAAGEELVQLRD